MFKKRLDRFEITVASLVYQLHENVEFGITVKVLECDLILSLAVVLFQKLPCVSL